MFVRSRMDKPVTFRKGGKSWTIKPHSVTLIDDPTVTAKELKGCYGARIDIISDEGTFKGSSEGRQPIKNVIKSKVEKPIVKKVNEKSLDDILAQVNKELGAIDDDKKVDTPAVNKPKEPTIIDGADVTVPKSKDTIVDNVHTESTGNNTKANKEEKKTKPTRTRRTTSNKAKVKRTTSKKTTKK